MSKTVVMPLKKEEVKLYELKPMNRHCGPLIGAISFFKVTR